MKLYFLALFLLFSCSNAQTDSSTFESNGSEDLFKTYGRWSGGRYFYCITFEKDMSFLETFFNLMESSTNSKTSGKFEIDGSKIKLIYSSRIEEREFTINHDVLNFTPDRGGLESHLSSKDEAISKCLNLRKISS